MNRIESFCIMAVLGCAVTGCGTMTNMNGGYVLMGIPKDGYPAPYGGVFLDVEFLGECHREFTKEPLISTYGSIVSLIDLPLTIIADTVTLPWLLANRETASTKTQSLPTGVIPAGASPVISIPDQSNSSK
jgi:uncharacterized protein YceK